MQFDNLTHCEIEEQAKRLLESYFASRNMSLSLPIPIEAIAEHYLGYDIEISDEGVFASPLVLGGIIFDQKKIIINAVAEAHEGRYSFTLAHEVGHHVLHKAVFEASDSARMVCREDANKPIEERQADHFAGALLMPEECIRRLYSSLRIPRRQYSGKAMKAVARRVMTAGGFSNVSNQAMIVRLHQLGLTKETIIQVVYRTMFKFIGRITVH
jgi:hypothetical protein